MLVTNAHKTELSMSMEISKDMNSIGSKFFSLICVFTNMPSIRDAGDFVFCIIDGIEICDEHDE